MKIVAKIFKNYQTKIGNFILEFWQNMYCAGGINGFLAPGVSNYSGLP
jgi:hypothetical protein